MELIITLLWLALIIVAIGMLGMAAAWMAAKWQVPREWQIGMGIVVVLALLIWFLINHGGEFSLGSATLD